VNDCYSPQTRRGNSDIDPSQIPTDIPSRSRHTEHNVVGPLQRSPGSAPALLTSYGIFPDLCQSKIMNLIFALITLLSCVYAGIISIAAADYQRLDNPVNQFLLLVGVALIIGGVYFSFWIFMQPEPTF
jgi:hypothetical protein